MDQHIQLHILRLYTNEGYALFAGNSSEGFNRQSLDVLSEWVSASYLKAQRRLDEVLRTRRLPWSLCLDWDGSQCGPTVAYGTFVELPNSQGRLHGVFFVHAVKLKGPNSLVPAVEGVIRHLSPMGLQKLLDGIADVAGGRKNGASLAVAVSRWLEECCPTGGSPITLPVAEGVTFIAHDCAGSSPIAWLAMALLHARQSPPWEVSDEILSGGGIGTRCWKEGRLGVGESIYASDLLSTVAKRADKTCDTDPQFIQAEKRGNGASSVPSAQQNRSESHPPEVSSSAPPLAPKGLALRDLLIIQPSRRMYIALGLVVTLIAAGLLFRRQSQTLDIDDAGPEIPQFENLTQGRIESRLAALEEELAHLKGWRESMEGRDLIQRVLGREAGAMEEAKRLWENEPEWLPVVLQEARKNKSKKSGILDLLIALKETDAAVLMRSQKDLAEFLDEMESDGPGPRTKVAIGALKDRMDQIGSP